MNARALLTPIAHAVRAVRAATPDLVGFVGAASIAEGAREIYRPAGFIVAGVLLLLGVFLHARGATPTADVAVDGQD